MQRRPTQTAALLSSEQRHHPADRPDEAQPAAPSNTSSSARESPRWLAEESRPVAPRRLSVRPPSASRRGIRRAACVTIKSSRLPRPALPAKLSAARVGAPFGSKATDLGGPVTSRSTSSCFSRTRAQVATKRRGAPKASTAAPSRDSRPKIFVKYHLKFIRSRRNHSGWDFFAADLQKKLRHGVFHTGSCELRRVAAACADRTARSSISGDNATSNLPNPPDKRRAFGDGNNAARVEHVEQVRALQTLVVGGQHREAPLGVALPGACRRPEDASLSRSCRSKSLRVVAGSA